MALIIGHKGAAALADENRVAAFALARSLGADGVELDVRRSQDGQLVVWHDATLPDGQQLLNTPWEDMRGDVDSLDQVLDASLGSTRRPSPNDGTSPSPEDASPLQLVNVEIKNMPGDQDYDGTYGVADAVADRLAARPSPQREQIVVSCFDVATLAAARARLDDVAPEVRTGWLVWLVTEPAEAVRLTVEGHHAALHPHHSMVTPDLIAAAHEADLTVNCWTCNDLDRISWLAEIGTDGIITDDPKAALSALGR